MWKQRPRAGEKTLPEGPGLSGDRDQPWLLTWHEGFPLLHIRVLKTGQGARCISTTRSSSKKSESCPTLVTPWTVAYQASLSMGFPRQKYWSRLSFPSPKDLPGPGIEPASLALAWGFFYHWATKASSKTRVSPTFQCYLMSYLCA